MTFQSLGLSEALLRAIAELGFEQPMPIQAEVIPYLLENKSDVVALAQTGTGKTAAYGLPLIQSIDLTRTETQAVVLCPTRELCVQIVSDLRDFAHYVDGLHVEPVYGGANIESQIKALRRGAQIIVATPGRLIDLMERKAAKLGTVSTVVLDEADEMLNMGFSESIDAILTGIPDKHQTLLFSATMGAEIEKIAKNYLHEPHEIVVGSRNEGAELVNHEFYMVHAKDKYLALRRLIDYYPRIYAIVFCRTRIETQEVADALVRDGYAAEALHGELSQAARDLAMAKFRRHQTTLLVATDVAARGIDVEDLSHVINYGLPDDVENYTHRSGRTGRAGKRGTSICIIHMREKGKVRQIEKVIGKDFQEKSLPSPKEICAKQLFRAIDKLEKTEVDEQQIEPFLPDVMQKLSWMDKEDVVKRFVSLTFGRILAYYANAPEIETPKAPEKQSRPTRKRAAHDSTPQEGFVRFFFGAGKRDHFYAREIIGLINRYTIDPVEIGRIDLKSNFSFFEVPESVADIVEGAMRNAKDKNGRHIVVDRADPEVPNDKSKRKERVTKRKDSAAANKEESGKRKGKAAAHKEESPKRKDKTGKPHAQKGKSDDWRQFFIPQPSGKRGKRNELRGEIPDFNEEGWAKPIRTKKKKK